MSRLKNWDDQDSWRDFFNTYWRLIYSVGRQAGLTETEAEDAVQETLISVAKTMPRFKYDPSVCSFKTWLRHLAQRRIVDQLRKRPPAHRAALPPATSTSRTDLLARIPDPRGPDLEDAWEQEWEKTVFAASVQRVRAKASVEQFQMFDFYVLRNWPVAKVTAALGVSAARVYLAKHRLMRMIKQEAKIFEKTGL